MWILIQITLIEYYLKNRGCDWGWNDGFDYEGFFRMIKTHVSDYFWFQT